MRMKDEVEKKMVKRVQRGGGGGEVEEAED
jgi:hypothetical protein